MQDNHICLYRECTEILMQSIESGHTPRDIENATRHVRQILDNEDYLRRDDLLNRRLGGVITEDELEELHRLERQYPSMKYVVTVQSVAKAVRFAYDEGFSDGVAHGSDPERYLPGELSWLESASRGKDPDEIEQERISKWMDERRDPDELE